MKTLNTLWYAVPATILAWWGGTGWGGWPGWWPGWGGWPPGWGG